MAEDFQRRLGHRIRRAVGPWIDYLAQRVGRPVTHIRASEYAGTVYCRIDHLETHLTDAGFQWDPVSLYHYTPAGTRADGSWVYRDSPLSDRQLHAVLFARSDDRIDVYAHDEYNWLRHPIRHAYQEDIRHEEGSRRMSRHLESLDLPTSRESVVRRKLAHVAQLSENRFFDSLPSI